jgi:hypothetical protein
MSAMFYTPSLSLLWNVPEIDVRNFPLITPYWFEICGSVSILYLILVFIGPSLLRNTKPFDLQYVVMFWNLSLSLLSVAMFIGMGWPTFRIAFEQDRVWHHIVTLAQPYDSETWSGPHAFWMYAYGISKVIELGDTVLLVLRKKNVQFLHWYHHTTVMFFTWFTMAMLASPGVIFAIINSFVHIIMYFYYFLTSLHYYPSWGKYITQLQLVQMVLGVIIAMSWTYYAYFTPESTPMRIPAHGYFVFAASSIYGSYFLLFMRFYYQRYLANRSAKASKASASAKASPSFSSTFSTTSPGSTTAPLSAEQKSR